MPDMTWSEMFKCARADLVMNWITGWTREIDLIFWIILVVWVLE
jgi:hypothetical protein